MLVPRRVRIGLDSNDIFVEVLICCSKTLGRSRFDAG